MKEIWKPVRGFEDYAEISNLGQIHRFERVYYSGRNHQAKHIQEESWTYGNETSDGYFMATIGGVVKGVHVWVYITFVGDIPEGLEVNHIDEDKHNNCVWNLNLMTRKENIRWGTGNARRAASNRGKKRPAEVGAKISAALKGNPNPKVADALRGRKRPDLSAAKSKAVQALDKDGNVVMEFPSTREAGRQGFDQSAVSACCRNCYIRSDNNIYKGYIWRFAL